ncbi:MAG: spore germination protein [Firmicutes bacterium]|nr:spore germination protein [Bacillota bacterium]
MRGMGYVLRQIVWQIMRPRRPGGPAGASGQGRATGKGGPAGSAGIRPAGPGTGAGGGNASGPGRGAGIVGAVLPGLPPWAFGSKESHVIQEKPGWLRELESVPVSPDVQVNFNTLTALFGGSLDLVRRQVRMDNFCAGVVMIDGLSQKEEIEHYIIQALHTSRLMSTQAGVPIDTAVASLQERAMDVVETKIADNMADVCAALLDGDSAVFGQGWSQCLLATTRGFQTRAVEEPRVEVSARGPREGFTENLLTNISLVRRRLKTPQLTVEHLRLGERTHTSIVLLYIRGVAKDEVLAELRRRLGLVRIDGVLESGYLEEFIRDRPFSVFPQALHTERPDRVCAALLEGRISILTDGTPFALIVPGQFILFLQAADDYYEHWTLSLGIRMFRVAGFLMALLLPALYVAITTYHQDVLPTPLALALAVQREAVPYPAAVEAFFMQVLFEILFEASLRLPRQMGQAVSIVGAVVMGEAAVRAGLVSPVMVIVVSLTAVASFTIPAYNMGLTVRLLRLPMILFGAAAGLFGIGMFSTLILLHMLSLHSFGIPYLAPMAPFIWEEQKDVFLRVPWWGLRTRPVAVGAADQIRGRANVAERLHGPPGAAQTPLPAREAETLTLGGAQVGAADPPRLPQGEAGP